MTPPQLSLLKEILAKHQLPCDDLALSPHQGVANITWLCGDVALRISEDPEYHEDLLTESVASPAVYRAGIGSPKPIHFSLTASGCTPPYSIYERVPGTNLASVTHLEDAEQFFVDYGRKLFTVHQLIVNDPNQFLDPAWEIEPQSLVERAASIGLAKEVIRLLAGGGESPLCFVHQDLHAENVLVVDESPVFIDWGDAGYGNPATDFRYIPPRFIGSALKGYGLDSASLRCGIALHLVDQFLYAIEHNRSYGRYGDTEVENLREFVKNTLS